MVKNLLAMQETWVQSLAWEDPWRGEWQPISVFLPGKFHGQRSLVGYNPWDRKETDTTEELTFSLSMHILSFPDGASGEATCQCRRHRRYGFSPWFGKIPWSRKWQLTPVFLPVKFQEQRSLAGYSPWGSRVSQIQLSTHIYTQCMYYHFHNLVNKCVQSMEIITNM